MTIFEKLVVKIKKDLNLDVEDFRRTYSGIHQRSRGAFVWVATDKETNRTVASCSSATELLKEDKLELFSKDLAFSTLEII